MWKRSVRLYLNGHTNSLTWKYYSTANVDHNGDDNEKPFSFENVDFFFGLTYRPLVSVENGHLKRIFLCGRTKAEVFE